LGSLKVRTIKESVDEIVETYRSIKKSPEKMRKAKEFGRIVREKGNIVGAAIEYIKRHPDEFEDALESWKEEMRRKGEKEEDIEKGENLMRALAEVLKEITQ